jgi:hypothetical protein
MSLLAEAPTGGDVQAYVRKATEDFTAMASSDFQADWLPLGDFRSTKELPYTHVTGFSFDVDTARRATPTESDLVSPLGQASESVPPIPEVGAEHEAAVRLELLARKSAAAISPEDDARLMVATERLRKLLPRVTASDFEALGDVAEKVATSRNAATALRAELGLDD